MQNNKKRRKISPSDIAAVSALTLLIGGIFLSYNYLKSKKIFAYDYISNIFYESNKEIYIEGNNQNIDNKEEGLVTDEYIGYLQIPKINVNKGFVDIRSKENNVEKNIFLVKGSDYPDKRKGNFIVAGHSGTGWNAFFNDLYKLNKEDIIKVKYKNKTYTYEIKNIYKQPKIGTIAIYRNYNKTTITLITCTNNDSKTQTIYIGELIDIKE